MPVSFRIVPQRDLVIVTYSGFVTVNESSIWAERYARHPDFRQDQKFLFDSSGVTGHEKDFVKFLKMQGLMTELFAQTGRDQLVGCFAPNEVSREMAVMAQRSWAPVDHMVIMIHDDEAEVLAFLGQPETCLADLLANAGMPD